MMIADRRHDRVVKANLLKDQRSDVGVDLCLLKLGWRETARLVEYVIGYGELSDIVKQRSGAECVNVQLSKTEQAAHPDRVDLRAADMTGAHLIARVNCGRERLDRCKMH